MCGIAGAIGPWAAGAAEVSTTALRHRGPDGIGFYHDGDVHLGMTRLSIIDLELGDQPIFNETGDIAVLFNGEIYNFRELRADLQARGHRFRTRSDTEVIVHLYEEHGERCVEHLQGMFAFVIVEKDRLFLARDRLGIKPLYYAFLLDQDMFVFASEIKALLRWPQFRPELDPQAFADTVMLGYPVEKKTLFRGICTLEPGTTLTLARQNGWLQPEIRRYYSLAAPTWAEANFEDSQESLIEQLRETIRSHLVADVPVALTLSGGLDSSLLAVMMREVVDGEILAFTTANRADHPDILHARAIAGQIRAKHDIWIPSFEEFLAALPGCVLAEERPASLRGMPWYMLCQRIGERVKVCLNGEGADELFGGYRDYTEPGFTARYLRAQMPAIRRLGVPLSSGAVEIVRKLCRWNTYDEYRAAVFEVNLGEPLVRHHLEMADRFSMAAGLELRVPYMDHLLVEFVNRLPHDFKVRQKDGPEPPLQKHILKKAAIRFFGEPFARIAARPKLGFPAAGTEHLAKFDQICEAALPSDYLEQHELGFCFQNKRALLMFELFEHIFFERRGDLSKGLDVMAFLRERSGAAKRQLSAALC